MSKSSTTIRRSAALSLALFLCAGMLAHAATWYVRTTGSDANNGTSAGTAFATIQKAINEAANGDVIDVGAGTFAPTTTTTVNKQVTIDGAGEGTTIIDVGGFNAWGIYITANNVTIKDLTVEGDATVNQQFTVKIGTGGPASTTNTVAEDFTLENVTITNVRRTGLDLNGVDGATITNVTVSNVTNGFGMSISSSHNVTVNGLTTSNCAWGDVGVFPANPDYQWNTTLDGPDNIVFTGTLSLGAGSISVQDGALSNARGTWVGTISNNAADDANVTVPASFSHVVNANRSDGLVLHNVGTESTIKALAATLAAATTPFTFSNITINDLDNDEWDVLPGLSIQTAVNAATAGNVVHVDAGTYAEALTINKKLSIIGSGSGTVIQKTGGTAVTYTTAGSGTSTTDRAQLRDVTISGSTKGILAGVVVSHLAIDNVSIENNTSYGIHINNTSGTMTDWVITNSTFDGNSSAMYISTAANINGLSVTGCTIENSANTGIYAGQSSGTPGGIANATFSNNTFTSNGPGPLINQAGMYIEKLTNSTISGNTFTNNGTSTNPRGIIINLKYGSYENVTISNNTLTENRGGTVTSGYGINVQGRNDASSYNTNPGSLDNLSITGNTVEGFLNGIEVDNAVDWNTTTVSNNSIANCTNGILGVIYGTGNTANATTEMDVNNNSITGATLAVVNYNPNGGTMNATCNWFGSSNAADVAGKVAGNVDVTPFLVDGTDTSTDPGFQPTTGACTGTGPILVYSDDAETNLVDTYLTIQSAINGSTTQDGHVVRVPAGTYTELLSINKQIALRGPNDGVAGNEARVSEAIVQFPLGAANGASLIKVESNVHNVTITGFDLRCQDATIPNYHYLIVTNKADNLTIRNNRMYGSEIAIYVLTDGTQTVYRTGMLVEGNYINGGPNVNSSYNRGMYIQGTSGTIQDNVVENCQVGIQYMPYTHLTSGVIRRNVVSASLIGLYHNYQNKGAAQVTWEQNVVSAAPNPQTGNALIVDGAYGSPVTFKGIQIITFGTEGTGTAPEVLFQNNIINATNPGGSTTSTDFQAVFVTTAGIGAVANLENNSFTGYTAGVVRADGLNATVNATCNWWGSNDAATVSTAAGNSSFLPFLTNGTDDDLAIGFQPVAGSCDGLGPVTSDDPVASYMTIQSAIDGSNAGATVTASAGTYAEAVALNKGVTVTGTGATITGLVTISNENAVLTDMTLAGTPIALTFTTDVDSYTLGTGNTFDAACTTFVETVAGNNITLPAGTDLGGLTDNYLIEDKINHVLDAGGLGIVRWNGNNLYVTSNSGSIQRAIDAATSSDAVNIDAATFNENPVLHKDIVLNSRNSLARRLGTNNYFVFGTTSLGTSNLSGFNTGDFNKIGVNTNGTVSEAITAVNTSGTVLLTTEVQSSGTAEAEFDAFTFTNKNITIEGNGTTGSNCDVQPVISINGENSVALTSEGDANRTLKNVTLMINASTGANFVRVTNGSIGDITVEDVRFQRGGQDITGLQPLTTPSALADGKDIPEFLQDGADVGFGPGKVLFGHGAPFNADNVVAAWKGNDANSNSVQTVYSYSTTSLNLSQTFLTRRPSRSVNNGDFNGNTVIGIPTSGDRMLQAIASSDVIAGDEKTVFVVFRTPSASNTDRVIYKHGDELSGISIIYDDAENVQFNIFNNRTPNVGTFETFETAVAPNTVAIAQLYFDGTSTTNRVGAALDWGTSEDTPVHWEDFADDADFSATSLSAPTLNLVSAINVGALSQGKTYFEGAAQTRSTPGFTLKGGFIAEVIVLNTADASIRNDVYCYLHRKYDLGNNNNGLERAIPVYDYEEEVLAGQSNVVWPNPATDLASVAFTVPEAQFVTITLVDALGRPVANIASEYMMAGEQIYDITLDTIPSGLYTVAINGFTFNTSAPVMVRK